MNIAAAVAAMIPAADLTRVADEVVAVVPELLPAVQRFVTGTLQLVVLHENQLMYGFGLG
jgi:hypothetical protein